MGLALAIFGVIYAALCIWLTVRAVNRRERWAKRILAAVVALPVLYVLSIGPAHWIYLKFAGPPWLAVTFRVVYAPYTWGIVNGPKWAPVIHAKYCQMWTD